MQKFGLQTNRGSKNSALELEIKKEQASALGRAGRKLRLSLEAYDDKQKTLLDPAEDQRLLDEISANVWALLLQREFLGFNHGNREWLLNKYCIPEGVLCGLGATKLK